MTSTPEAVTGETTVSAGSGQDELPTLLIVDDDDSIRWAMSRAFEKRGYAVTTASSVPAALDLLQTFSPEFALVDLRMPGPSGLTLVARLKQADPNTRIVMLTGYASIATAVEAIKLGALDYLVKPVDADIVEAAFQHQTGNPEVDASDNVISVDRLAWEHIQRTLAQNDGNISATARALGMHRRTLQRKLSKRPVRIASAPPRPALGLPPAITLAAAPAARAPRPSLKFLPPIVWLVRLLVGAYPRWVGSTPTAAQRIYFANHSSHMDTVVLWAALPRSLRANTRPVAARDYWGKGGIRTRIACDELNVVMIDRAREDPEADPLAPLRDALEHGFSLILFPEGTRNPQPLPAPFRSGLYHLAQQFPEVELIPVYLDNLHRSMPKGALLPVPIICTVRFGSPLTRVPDETREAFLVRARAAVVALAQD